jgi:hypothetical protein
MWAILLAPTFREVYLPRLFLLGLFQAITGTDTVKSETAICEIRTKFE